MHLVKTLHYIYKINKELEDKQNQNDLNEGFGKV